MNISKASEVERWTLTKLLLFSTEIYLKVDIQKMYKIHTFKQQWRIKYNGGKYWRHTHHQCQYWKPRSDDVLLSLMIREENQSVIDRSYESHSLKITDNLAEYKLLGFTGLISEYLLESSIPPNTYMYVIQQNIWTTTQSFTAQTMATQYTFQLNFGQKTQILQA